MNLPDDAPRKKQHKPKLQTWVIVLSTIAIVVSLASAGFSAFVYLDTPSQIHNYVQSHKSELKGDKGNTGEMGPRGMSGMNGSNGSNSYSPTYCSTYDYSFGSSTSCY